MKYWLKCFIVSLIFILGLNLICTILNYIGIINFNVVSILKYIIPFISIFVGGYLIGNKSMNKGWLEGIKFSLIFIILFIILNLFYGFNYKQLILNILDLLFF